MSDFLQLPLAQQSLPPLDGMYWLMLTSRVLHIVGATILAGGLFYLCAVVHVGQGAESPSGEMRARWAKWVGIATLLLIVTGLFNFIMYVRLYDRLGGAYHGMFGVKFLASLGVFFLAAMLAGRTAVADRFRQNARRWLSIAVGLTLLIVVLAAVMRTVPHVPKPDADGAPVLMAPAN